MKKYNIEKDYLTFIKEFPDYILYTGSFSKYLIEKHNIEKKYIDWDIWKFRDGHRERFIKISRGKYLDTYFVDDEENVYLQTGNNILRKYRIRDTYEINRRYNNKTFTNDINSEYFEYLSGLNSETLKYFELFELFKAISRFSKINEESAFKKIDKFFNINLKKDYSKLLLPAKKYSSKILKEIIQHYESRRN